jgi:Ca-activated chloride channel family protein
MRFEFTNPSALLLLLLIPAAVLPALFSFRRSGLRPLRRSPRLIYTLATRSLLVLLIVFALAGLRFQTSSRDVAVIFLLDVSASVSVQEHRSAIDFINREIDHAAPTDYVGVIAFAREPSVELAPTQKQRLEGWRLTQISSNPPRDFTDIAAALRLAAAVVPQSAVGRLVLISDGNENLESSESVARTLAADGIEVYSRSMKTNAGQPEVAVRELAAPAHLAEGESFDLKTTIDSTRDTDAVLRLYRNNSIVAERRLRLAAGGDNVFVLPIREDRKGFYTYGVDVEALDADTFKQNNSREALVMVDGRPKTLYLYGDSAPSAAMARVLAEGKFDADLKAASAAPTTLAGFQDYDLVIFDNVPAAVLTRSQMQMVKSYVHDLGGGFIMIGGEKSFGAGGYYKTPVEDVLPVSLDIRNKKHFPSLALALVIDKSGSMNETQGGRSKIELAVEAASAAVDSLSERDQVAVIVFDTEARPVVGLTPVEDKRSIKRALGEITAFGGTAIYPGIDMAYQYLLSSDAKIKHIIVLSDGESMPGDYPGITRAIRDAGMTLSSVAVGDEADLDLMTMLAEAGGGRFYATDRPENLLNIFTREAFLASREAIIEEPFVPRLASPSQAIAGIDWSHAPQLLGYVGTAERTPGAAGFDSARRQPASASPGAASQAPSSPATLSLISDKDDPIYAEWQYGLGRSAAFTSDAKSRWAAPWMNWPGFGQFWTQVMRSTLRRDRAAGGLQVTARVDFDDGRSSASESGLAVASGFALGRTGHIDVEATTEAGAFANELRLLAHVVAPDLTSLDVPLEQTAAGRYEARFPAEAQGAYIVSIMRQGESRQAELRQGDHSTESGSDRATLNGQSKLEQASSQESAAQESSTPLAITGAVKSYSPEFNISPDDSGLLARLSQATGGQVIDAETGATNKPPAESAESPPADGPVSSAPAPRGIDLFERRASRTIPHDVWDKLLVLALLLLPIDAAIRRLRLNREDLRSGLSAVMRWSSSFLPWLRPAILETDGSGTAAVGLAQLKTSRSRIRLRLSQDGEEAVQPSNEAASTESALVGERRSVPRVSDLQPESPSGTQVSPDQPGDNQPLPSRLLKARGKRRD